MKYRIEYTHTAEVEQEQAFAVIHEQTPKEVEEWKRGLIEAIHSLRSNPERCSYIAEEQFLISGIRQLLYAKGRWMFRVFFVVQDSVVRVLHVREGRHGDWERQIN